MRLSKQQMAQHIANLAAAHDIRVTLQRSSRNAWAIREGDGAADEIIIPPVRSEITYTVALHEIGHILGRYQRSRYRMIRERWAWQWARENALTWTPRIEHFAAIRWLKPET